MTKNQKDPTQPIRLKASQYAGVDEGTACTQSSFKVGKKAFLFIGMQGGRYKAMFKLHDSREEAAQLADKNPDQYEVGSTAWVTVRFTAEQPVPKKIWTKWLDESYHLSVAGTAGKTNARTATKKKRTAAKKKK